VRYECIGEIFCAKKMRKHGFTLIELMVVVIIAAIGLFAITTLLYSAYRDWFTSKEIKALQEDMDLAALTVKSVLEEAQWGDGLEDNITEGRARISVGYTEDDKIIWEKELYKYDGELRLKDVGESDVNGYAIIRTLEDIAFYESDVKFPDEEDERHGLKNTLFVEITVAGTGKIAGRTIENQFLVRLRN
jgi:prepilin-type N-terminal cleavage/methylation domain-containing protein